ncbi:MAG: acyltransferase [Methanospirillaceae archaeon]|nr:acyltransferase [Methanospirillaceae archaeon]
MKRIFCRIIKFWLKILSKLQLNSFDQYREHIAVDSTAIIDPCASIKIFNLPPINKICLEIGENSHIFSNFSILKSNAKIKIGKRCQLGNSKFICAEKITIDDDVLMAWGCTIIDTDSHSIFWQQRKNDVVQCYNDYLMDKNNFILNKDWTFVKSDPIVINKHVWIGFNVSILKGVTIGEGSVIGANSVVTSDIPAYSLVAGNPAKIIKKINNE